MSCILRIIGNELNLNDLLKVNLIADTTWEKGTPRLKTKPDGKKHLHSGASYLASLADFDEFEQQISDSIKYLKQNNKLIQEIMSLPDVDEASLDFGINKRDVIVQCDFFPLELIKIAGELGLGIELSQYPQAEE